MYISPFAAGVFATLGSGMILLIVWSMLHADEDK